MKIVMETFPVKTKKRNEFVDITSQVESIVKNSGITNGDVIVYCPHTTAAITINENADPSVVDDLLLTLNDLIPHAKPGYRHSEGNSDAHAKSSIFGCSQQLLIHDKRLVTGTWQGLYFCEFDGPRSRKVNVQIRGEK